MKIKINYICIYASPAKVTTTTIQGVITPTPIPTNAKVMTTKTTFTSYIAGYTTTDSKGSPSTVPPSTVVVEENIAVTAPATSTINSGSRINLPVFNVHGLCSVAMSLVIVTTTFVFTLLS